MYRIHQFAALAGVTVKALRHYDRMGLLKPQRTESGYRAYSDADLVRLQQIVALKFIGLSLAQIRDLLQRRALPLGEALRAQRAALHHRRHQLDRAIAAIERAQAAMASRDTSDAALLTQLIEVLSMPDVDVLKKYFSDDAWERWRARHSTWPPEEWVALFRELQSALDEDPASPRAEALVVRYVALFEAEAQNDPNIRTALRKAAGDHESWRAFLQASMPDVDVAGITRFVASAAWARWQAPDGRSYETPMVRPTASRARTSLLRDFEALLGEHPHAERVQQLVARWEALTDEESGGDPEIKEQILRAASRWREWPDGMRRWVAYTYGMPQDQFERVMAFIAAAREQAA